jgi:hypothetical protein
MAGVWPHQFFITFESSPRAAATLPSSRIESPARRLPIPIQDERARQSVRHSMIVMIVVIDVDHPK